MANLVLDIGNTLQKAAIFENGNLRGIIRKSLLQKADLQLFIDEFQINSAIISEVGEIDKETFEFIKNNFFTLKLSTKLKLPIKIFYETPEQLGNDRVAAAVAAWSQFPENDVLVIQAGTCLVFDFVNRKGEYLGGAISPGLQMRFKALSTFTEKLPLVTPDCNAPLPDSIVGTSTEKSIITGVLHGITDEIDSEIERYRSQFPTLKVILTGGDMPYLKKSIKNTIFANSNLVLEGLNKILETNAIR